jgi:hypothetical protein
VSNRAPPTGPFHALHPTAALLAALATVGPFSIDTYLPALHAIGED